MHLEKVPNKSLTHKLLHSKLVWVGGTAIGLSAAYVDSYIKGNTGCFLESGDSVCKIPKLSCCNPADSPYVETCSDAILTRLRIPKTACRQWNATECCQDCDCVYHDCQPNEAMRCRKPTLAQALTYFTDHMVSAVANKASLWLKLVLIGFCGIVLGGLIYTWTKK